MSFRLLRKRSFMDWKDRKEKPVGRMNEDAELRVVENGPVRVALQVKRKGRNSEITQTFSLSKGESGKRLEVTNKLDWQSREVSLKAAFPLTVANENATYNLGVGTIARSNNNEKKFEVPSKEWFDLTDKSGRYGVSILEDCKYGSDKPADNTVRLTLLYTPAAKHYVYQSTQDWGIHDFKYAIYGHKGNWNTAETPWQAKFLNEPLLAFESPKHEANTCIWYHTHTIRWSRCGQCGCNRSKVRRRYIDVGRSSNRRKRSSDRFG